MLWQARQLAKHAGHTALFVELTCGLAEFNWKFKGNVKTAQRLFRRGLELRLKTLGLEHIDTASTLNAVGIFAAQQGEFEEARRLITDAIRIRIKLLGSGHLSVAEAYHNLAQVQEDLHNQHEAAELYMSALRAKRQALPESHVSIADTENHLIKLWTSMDRHDESVHLLRGCLARCLSTVGELHESTASVRLNLGHALHMLASTRRDSEYRSQLDESGELLEAALAVRRAIFHKRHPSVAECRANLGHVHFKKQEFDAARSHFSAALKINRRHYGRQNCEMALWSFWLGKALIKLGLSCRGLDRLQVALRVSESLTRLGQKSPLAGESLDEVRALLGGGGGEQRPGDSGAGGGVCTGAPPSLPEPPEEPTVALALVAGGPPVAACAVAVATTPPPPTATAPACSPPPPPPQRMRPQRLATPSPSPTPSLSEGETDGGVGGADGRFGADWGGAGTFRLAPFERSLGSPQSASGSGTGGSGVLGGTPSGPSRHASSSSASSLRPPPPLRPRELASSSSSTSLQPSSQPAASPQSACGSITMRLPPSAERRSFSPSLADSSSSGEDSSSDGCGGPGAEEIYCDAPPEEPSAARKPPRRLSYPGIVRHVRRSVKEYYGTQYYDGQPH